MGPTSDIQPLSVEPTTTSRRRRKKSVVWDHFTVETLPDGSTRACCQLCKQTFAYSTGAKLSGTSHLKRHILMGSCPVLRQEKKQLTAASTPEGWSTEPPPRRRYRSGLNFSDAFDQEESCVQLVKMIIMHDYPLNMVEHIAFIAFVQGLQPKFRMPDVNTVEAKIMTVYNKGKQDLVLLLGSVPGRVSLSICMWSTSQTLGYVSLTGHFIDNDWKLHKRLLNFMMVSSPHSENALSEAIEFFLSGWDMKSKLFTITLDNNCPSHDIYSANLRDHLSNKNNLVLKRQLFVVRCYAHILNVVSQDAIASIHGIVYNIRESIKYVKSSVASEEKFLEIVQHLQISGTQNLSLDVQMQWNTTYMMLANALEFQQAFAFLETCDPNYNEAPSAEDWKKVEIVCTYLKLLYDSAHVIMDAACLTSNIYFHEASKIQLELKNAASSEDPMVVSIAKDMYEKFDKYWKDCSLILAVAVIMDPRFKMKLVEFCFGKIYGDDATSYINVVNDAVHDLYHEYTAQPMPQSSSYVVHQEERDTVNLDIAEASITEFSDVYMNNVEHNMFEMENIKLENDNTDNVKLEDVGQDSFKLETTTTGHVEDANMEFEASEFDYHMTIVDNYNSHDDNGDNGFEDFKHSNGQLGIAFSNRNDLVDFDLFVTETGVPQQTKSELEQYLEEALEPRIQEFDILYWWRLKPLKYPILSKMARDVLSIPMSMPSSGAIFSSGSGIRVLDDYRSLLHPQTVQALFCAKDWLQYSPSVVETLPATVRNEVQHGLQK